MSQSVRRSRGGPRSFTARLEVVVFAATLTSALALAWVSMQTLRAVVAADASAGARRLVHVAGTETRAFALEAAHELERLAWLVAPSPDATDAARRLSVHGARLANGPLIESVLLADRDGHVISAVGVESPPATITLPFRFDDRTPSLASVSDGTRTRIVLDGVVPRTGPMRAPLVLQARLRESVLAKRLHEAVGDAPVALAMIDAEGRPLVRAGSLPRATSDGSTRPLPTTAAEIDAFGAGWRVLVQLDEDAALGDRSALVRQTLVVELAIVLVASLAAFFASSSLMRPIRQLSEAAGRLRDGERDVPLPRPKRQDEVGVLARTFAEMVERAREAQVELEQRQRALESSRAELLRRNAELHQANEVLEQLAITDGLTRIHNHRFFQDQLTKEVKRADRTGAPLALLVVDLDDFKKLNDRHGHEVGDAVLQRVAEVLVEETRDHDLVARYGGEEFVVLAPDTDLAGATALAEKLRVSVAARPVEIEGPGEGIRVTVSIGVAAYAGDRARLFREADRALYDAKHAGKDCVVVADDGR